MERYHRVTRPGLALEQRAEEGYQNKVDFPSVLSSGPFLILLFLADRTKPVLWLTRTKTGE